MIRTIAALGLCLAATGYVQPEAASAADGGGECSGNVIDYVPFKTRNGVKIGQLQLYYNPRSGSNCAIMYHGGPAWGKAAFTHVALFLYASGSAREIKRNEGSSFRYQAGPIRTDGTKRCIAAAGGISWNGSYHHASTEYHCD